MAIRERVGKQTQHSDRKPAEPEAAPDKTAARTQPAQTDPGKDERVETDARLRDTHGCSSLSDGLSKHWPALGVSQPGSPCSSIWG